MQRTKSKILSILLILVMLLTLLPTTALAADYPGPTYVSVDGGKSFTADKLYFKNGETQCSADSANYNAHYDPTTGTLTLNGYDGGAIVLGGAEQGDLTIKLMGNNTIHSTTSQHGVAGNTASGSITITADSSSDTLTINVSNSTSYVYGIDGIQRSVTITGSADVTIIAEAKSTDKLCFGINSLDTVSILGNASVDIKSKVPENNTGSNFCCGINGKKVAIETDGTIMIDVTAAGDAGADSYGVDTTSSTTLTKVGEMQVKWKEGTFPYVGGAISRGGSFDINTHAVNVDKDNCFASYRFGTPRTVTVEDGTFTGPGVPKATKYSGKFLENDTVSIKPSEKKSSDGTLIPFKEWTSSNVTLSSPTTENNSFTVPGEDVTVTAKHSPFVGTPTFTPTDSTGTEGTLTFKTVVKPGDGSEYFSLVKDGDQNNENNYKRLRRMNTLSSASPYEYSRKTTPSGTDQVEAGDYYVAEKLNGAWYLSEKFTVNYTAAPTSATLTGITVKKAPDKVTYNEGETFDATGMVIEATYNDGSTKDVTGYTYAPTAALTTSDTTITISYTEGSVTQTCTQAITVNAAPATKTLTGISVKTAPTKVTYNEGETFDATGMVIEATYSDSTKKDVTGYTYAPTAALTTSDTTITISYTEGGVNKTCTQAITVNAAPTEYTITFDVNGGSGTIPSQTTSGQKLSSLPTATHSGSYSFAGWYTAASGGTQITTAYVFSANTTVYAHWTYTGGGGGWYYTYYTIKATAGTNGSISPSGWTSVRDGWDQTFTITPDKGYAVAKVLVDGKSVGSVKSYTFKNVTKDHTIEAIFMKSNGNPATGVFVDVAEGSYYEESIDWAVEKGITNGVSSNMFAPNDPCTRAQIVTFLWRAAGSPAPKSMSSFTDVPAGAFYAKAVAWAVENGITSGTGESKFSPNSTCTRAQAVTFLYRASGSPAVSGKAEFSDVSSTAFYADAVAWAAKKVITTGIGGGLFGSDNDCTRGQIVTFLWRAMAE